jgi:hypothetical protein
VDPGVDGTPGGRPSVLVVTIGSPRQLFAATTVFHEPGRSPISGDYEGIDQVLGFLGTLAEQVFHVRDGRITETWSHHHDQHDFDAFWA